MKSEGAIRNRLEEYQARAHQLEERVIAAGWERSTENLQIDLDEYNMFIALLKWVLEE